MEWLKAKVALMIIFIMWAYLIILDSPYMVYAYLHDRRNKPDTQKGKLHSVLLGQDIYVNTQLGGYFRTTISSELGNQSKTRKSGKAAAKVVDLLFYIAGDDPNHCVNAIEEEDKHWFNAKYALPSFVLWLSLRVLMITLLISFI